MPKSVSGVFVARLHSTMSEANRPRATLTLVAMGLVLEILRVVGDSHILSLY